MSPPDTALVADQRIFAEFDIAPADLAYLRSVPETLTVEIQDWIIAQWRAEVEALPWFEELGLTPEQAATVAEIAGSFLARLLSGDRVEDLYGEIERAALVARQHGVKNTDLFQAFSKLESILTGVALQLFASPDRQTVALVTLAKFLKSLLYVVMETYRREAAAELEGRNSELASALDRQTATAEVLGVISASPGAVEPVFDAILDSAIRLCDAHMGYVWRVEDGTFFRTAERGVPPDFADYLRRTAPAYRPPPSTGTYRMWATKSTVQVDDYRDNQGYAEGNPMSVAFVEQGRARTALFVPMLSGGEVIGAIIIYRPRVRRFDDKQIELVENFAKQAVIAIENARLFDELRQRTHDLEESLEYQTATSDVLRVISQSTFDLEPVLQTVLDTAVRLCRAGPSEIFRLEGDGYRFAVGTWDQSPQYREFEKTVVLRPEPGTLVGRTAMERRPVHVHDAWTDPLYAQKEEARIGNFHTMLGVPLMREAEVIGVIALSRPQVEPFTEREIQLVTTFADQAVIAIENTRLLTELRESLEQQRAIAEVLGVINANPGNLQPVFDAMTEKATRLCDAVMGGLWIIDGERAKIVAIAGFAPEFVEVGRRVERGELELPQSIHRIMGGERVINSADLAEMDTPHARLAAEGGVRSHLWVALAKDTGPVGAFGIARREVKPFTDSQIALLQNFAAQAVIAMDNARLLDEIRQRQAELRVTFDNMGDGVAMFDAELRLAAWNRNFQTLLDLPDGFVAERPHFAAYLRHLAERGEYGAGDIDAELQRRLDRIDQELRFERTRPDGRIIEVRRNPVPGGGFVLIYGDITERKRAEAEIRAARDAAETALTELRQTQQQLVVQQKMAALGQLTAGIAHEIKNPLNFVNNFAGLSHELLDELKEIAAPGFAGLEADARAEIDDTIALLTGNLDKIAEHGRRADNIVKSMLAHSRGSSGERQAVDLNALVDEALNLAYHGARAQDQGFNITMERAFGEGIAPVELVPQDITRVFLNLIGNGFYAADKRAKAAGDGFRPVLRVATRAAGEAVEIRVRDNGIGIAPEHRERLFQPFFTTKPTGEGTGLGLSISFDIVTQQHGGTIEVASEPGQFTEFTIRLPRRS